MRHVEADYYYDRVDQLNLLFGGGISGTTGTLLRSALAFGNLNAQVNAVELKKQYTLAIIGYLVGGGMHTYHESMVIAEKVGVPYISGRYDVSMPTSFTALPSYTNWQQRYFDIVSLGDQHGVFVAPVPSANNPQLRHTGASAMHDALGTPPAVTFG
ncbi:MAG: cytotoxin Mcf [Pseudomonadota bacterium]